LAVRLSVEMHIHAHFSAGDFDSYVYGMRSGFISGSVHARLQVSAFSGCDLFHPV